VNTYPICVISFVFLFIFSFSFFVGGVALIIFDTSLFVEWEVVRVNRSAVVITILLD